jgi:uncharacterized protein YdhG (YjbR/CyaY superfamily)
MDESTPVTDYVAGLPESRRRTIAAIYAAARVLAPDATEGVRYAMPALVLDGKGLLSVMSTKKHIGIYPHSGSVVQDFADRLRELGIGTTKGAIQLPDGVTLPSGLLDEVLRARLRELGR